MPVFLYSSCPWRTNDIPTLTAAFLGTRRGRWRPNRSAAAARYWASLPAATDGRERCAPCPAQPHAGECGHCCEHGGRPSWSTTPAMTSQERRVRATHLCSEGSCVRRVLVELSTEMEARSPAKVLLVCADRDAESAALVPRLGANERLVPRGIS